MFTEKDLIAGETVLVGKITELRVLYLGNAGLVHFISLTDFFEFCDDSNYTIQELNDLYTIEQPKSKVVPLEKKVYDFVPVRVRDKKNQKWENAFLVAVVTHTEYPYKVIDESREYDGFKYCEFINEQ